ncbi:MAG: hypothetical protein CMB08_06900 [Euryarchaeota archaeon]|nr:hypothetical protein [Euryarchaeota archaeon]
MVPAGAESHPEAVGVCRDQGEGQEKVGQQQQLVGLGDRRRKQEGQVEEEEEEGAVLERLRAHAGQGAVLGWQLPQEEVNVIL